MVKRALTLLTSILFALPLLMPFNIYANVENQIVPTWSQSQQQSQWANKFRVTNFCESSNNPQNYSCQLTITVNGDYYGYVYFDGYINNQIILDYATMFISGGKGTYYYSWYANGLKEINKVNIAGLSLVSPTDNIDLTQIIQLLTSINSYNQQIEGNQDTQIQELQTVINDLIVSNGYLETISKLRSFNFPIESYAFANQFLSMPIVDMKQYYSYNYPLFQIDNTFTIRSMWSNRENLKQVMILGVSENINNMTTFDSIFDYENLNVLSFSELFRNDRNNYFSIFKIEFNVSDYSNNYVTFTPKKKINIMPIYLNYMSVNHISTEFALIYGLSNPLLNNLNIIANGTAQSSSAASSNDLANSQLQTESNTLFQQENGFKSDMQNAMQNVNNTFRLQDMGTKFVNSAQWVRTQFEMLTNNTPFASLITFSLITGLALILLGKVYR